MFLEIPNENRIKSVLRQSHYFLTCRIGEFRGRLTFDGFSLSPTPPWFSVNFRLMSKSEYQKKYCGNIAWLLKHHLISECSGTAKRQEFMTVEPR